jgi:hypothetical protein
MAIPDWVTQQVQPLPGAMSWQPGPQNALEAAVQAGIPYQDPASPQPLMSVAPEQQPMTSMPPVAPVAQPAQLPVGGMSVALEQPAVSELNYTPEQPEPTAVPQPAPVDPAEQTVNALLQNYLTGSRRAVPESVVKAAETWQQSAPGALPGQEGPYAAAQQALEEQQNEMLLDQRLAMQDRADLYDQEAQLAFDQGRGFAAEAASIQADQEQRKAVIDQRVGELDRLIEQRSKLQSSFAERNPVRDMSMWTRIAIGLGAAGQALAGGQNAALEIAMREIDADLAHEKDKVDALGAQIAGKHTLLGDLLQKFMDPTAAYHAARAAKLGMYESGYREQAAKEKSAEMRAAMLSAADSLSVQRAQEKLSSLTAEHATLMRWRPAGVAGNKGGLAGLQRFAADMGMKPGTPEYQEFMNRGITGKLPEYILSGMVNAGAVPSKDELAFARFNQDHKVRMPDGRIGYVKDKTDFEKTTTSLNKMDQNLGRLRKYVVSGSPWNPTDRANVEAITNMAMGEIRVMLGLGVMSESDKELAQKLTGEFVNDRVPFADKLKRLETLEQLTSQTRREYESRISADPNADTSLVPSIRSVRAK